MSELAALSATVHGRVQGVNFRLFVIRRARALGLKGYARNLSGGRAVEVYAEGERTGLRDLLGHLRSGPSMARVERVDVKWSSYSGSFTDFQVR